MSKVKNKILHVKKQITKTSCDWETFYEDDEVPIEWRKLFLDQGGQFKEEGLEHPKEVETLEEVKEAPEEEKKVWTREELFTENKAKQVELLNELEAEKVPRYEKDRVELILELQGDK